MNREQFQVQLNRLVECFGKSAYGTERCALVWRAVDGQSIEWFKRTVDGFISSSRQAPMVVDFKDAAAEERERQWNGTKHLDTASAQWNPRPACEYCRDNGVYVATNRNPEIVGLYAFRCHCERGHADPRRAIPQFKQDHIAQGFVYCDLTKRRETPMGAVKV